MIKLALEKVWRYFENDKDKYVCISIQIPFLKNEIVSGFYTYKIFSDNLLYQKKIYLNIEGSKIETIGSHEDPLISNQNEYLISLHVDIKEAILNEIVSISFENANSVIKEYNNIDFKHILSVNNTENTTLVEYLATTKIDSTLRLHKGYINGVYQEEEFLMKANESIDIKNLLLECEYLGVQFSYELNGVDIEEKYIPIGQKNMSVSCDYYDGKHLYSSLFPNVKKYQKLLYIENKMNESKYLTQIKEDWVEINNIPDLIGYARKNKPVFFETDINLIKQQYLDKYTYGINKTISSKKFINIKHINTEICNNCEKNYKCLQLVPSALSYDLYKNVVNINNKNKCNIYKIID